MCGVSDATLKSQPPEKSSCAICCGLLLPNAGRGLSQRIVKRTYGCRPALCRSRRYQNAALRLAALSRAIQTKVTESYRLVRSSDCCSNMSAWHLFVGKKLYPPMMIYVNVSNVVSREIHSPRP